MTSLVVFIKSIPKTALFPLMTLAPLRWKDRQLINSNSNKRNINEWQCPYYLTVLSYFFLGLRIVWEMLYLKSFRAFERWKHMKWESWVHLSIISYLSTTTVWIDIVILPLVSFKRHTFFLYCIFSFGKMVCVV